MLGWDRVLVAVCFAVWVQVQEGVWVHVLKKVELVIKIMTLKILKNDKTKLQIWVLRTDGKKAGLDGELVGISESSTSTEHSEESRGVGGIIRDVE